jgi:hypothetical protein
MGTAPRCPFGCKQDTVHVSCSFQQLNPRKCEEWRPWDPGFYAQGPTNIWEVWVLNVDGHRVVIVADCFPGTSARTITALREVVKSIRFLST